MAGDGDGSVGRLLLCVACLCIGEINCQFSYILVNDDASTGTGTGTETGIGTGTGTGTGAGSIRLVLHEESEVFHIWRVIAQRHPARTDAVVVPCSHYDVYMALTAQLRPPTFCGCWRPPAEAGSNAYDVTIGRGIDAVLRENHSERDDVPVTYVSDSVPIGQMVRRHRSCHDLGPIDFLQAGRAAVITLVVICDDDRRPNDVWLTIKGSVTLMTPLVNALFITSDSLRDHTTNASIPYNLDTVTYLAPTRCQLYPNETAGPGTGSWDFGHLECPPAAVVTSWSRETDDVISGDLDLAAKVFNMTFGGFKGRTLRVGVLEYDPFVRIDRPCDHCDPIFSGYCIDILGILATFLDFEPYIYNLNDEWPSLTDGEWSGAIRYLMDGEMDILLSGLTISADRQAAVDFSFPFWEEKLGMIVGTIRASNFYLIRPLHPYVWACYGGMALVVACLLYFTPGHGRVALVFHYFTHLFGGLFGKGLPYLPNSGSGRFLVACFWICVVIISATYNSNLTSFLTVTNEKLPFQTLEEVVASDQYFLYTYESGLTKTWLQESDLGIAAAAWQKIESDNSLYRVEDQQDMVNDIVINGAPYVMIGDYTEMTTLGIASEACEWGMMRETFLPVGFAVAFQKGTPFLDEFDRIVLGMHSAGIFTFLKRRHFRYLEERACGEFVQATSKPIGLQRTWPLFAITGALLVLAFSALLGERMYRIQFDPLGSTGDTKVPYKTWH